MSNQNLVRDARALVSKLDSLKYLPAAASAQKFLLAALKTGKTGDLQNAIKRAQQWEKMAKGRINAFTEKSMDCQKQTELDYRLQKELNKKTSDLLSFYVSSL